MLRNSTFAEDLKPAPRSRNDPLPKIDDFGRPSRDWNNVSHFSIAADSNACELATDIVMIDSVGIKSTTAPLHHSSVSSVLSIGDCLEEVFVAPNASNVLGRAGSFSAEILRTRKRRGSIFTALERKTVHPAVAKIIAVNGRRAGLQKDGVQGNVTFVDRSVREIRVANAEVQAADLESCKWQSCQPSTDWSAR